MKVSATKVAPIVAGLALVVVAVMAATTFVFSGTAYGLTCMPTQSGLVISRDSTAAVDYKVYYGYSGGARWAPGGYSSSNSSQTIPAGVAVVSVQHPSGNQTTRSSTSVDNRMMLVVFSDGVIVHGLPLSEVLPVGGYNSVSSLAVSAASTLPVSLGSATVNTSGTVSGSSSGTASVSGTLTVDPWKTAGLPDGWQIVLVGVAMVSVGWGVVNVFSS